jgi:2-succinyl-5-enolpyruvyl-6-hydroxy-3-cyclohexene-1-carboxylate synthase
VKPYDTSEKWNARLLAFLLKAHGCQHIVVAPGSRNAPLIEALVNDPDYRLYSVPDERAAAFTALGLTLQHRRPAAVVCTSGSAAANFLPAATEAYYQQLPLVLLTADRPLEWIDQGIGQTIDQHGLYGRHVQAETALLRDTGDALSRSYNERKANEVLLASAKGPVHINIPFAEPLYEHRTHDPAERFRVIRRTPLEASLSAEALRELGRSWAQKKRIWVLAGQMPPNPALAEALETLQARSPFLLLTESLSNLEGPRQIGSIDRLINTLNEEQKEKLRPDLVITLGGEVVSKMVKNFLHQHQAFEHWHLGATTALKDTFWRLTQQIDLAPEAFFRSLAAQVAPTTDSAWRDYWLAQDEKRSAWTRAYTEQAPHSDFKVTAQLLRHLPQGSLVHWANSASVRYAQLFDRPAGIAHYANRGTSGIDGCTSTALGHALAAGAPVTLVTGDVAFLYDAAAFWNDALPHQLRVVVLNNQGGNIFRIINGPRSWDHFERLQETHHAHDLSAVGQMYGVAYQKHSPSEALSRGFEWLYAQQQAAILEVPTPRAENPGTLGRFFKYLAENNDKQENG